MFVVVFTFPPVAVKNTNDLYYNIYCPVKQLIFMAKACLISS